MAGEPIPTRACDRADTASRSWAIGATEIVEILVANGVLILAMWLRHGGLEQLGTVAGSLTAAGQLSALFGTYFALIQLVLMSRSPWLDQVFGMDGLAVAHRWLGFATVWLLGGHVVLTTTGYALSDGSTVIEELWTLVTTYPYVLMALASAGLFGAVAVSSIRAARRKLAYETWYGIHLYAYLAIALGFLHQLFVGADFVHDPVAVGYWVGLYVVTIGLILVFRIGRPVWLSARHRLRVARVVAETPGVYSIYVTGRELRRAGGPLRPILHLALPDRRRLVAGTPVLPVVGRTTSSCGSHQGPRRLVDALKAVPIGTRVVIEGPYGVLTERVGRDPGSC